jgi:hypothetical protein
MRQGDFEIEKLKKLNKSLMLYVGLSGEYPEVGNSGRSSRGFILPELTGNKSVKA